MIGGGIVTVGTSATPIGALVDDETVTYMMQNTSGVTIYIGGADVSDTVYGHALATGGTLTVTVPAAGRVYAAVAADTAPLNVLGVS